MISPTVWCSASWKACHFLSIAFLAQPLGWASVLLVWFCAELNIGSKAMGLRPHKALYGFHMRFVVVGFGGRARGGKVIRSLRE